MRRRTFDLLPTGLVGALLGALTVLFGFVVGYVDVLVGQHVGQPGNGANVTVLAIMMAILSLGFVIYGAAIMRRALR